LCKIGLGGPKKRMSFNSTVIQLGKRRSLTKFSRIMCIYTWVCVGVCVCVKLIVLCVWSSVCSCSSHLTTESMCYTNNVYLNLVSVYHIWVLWALVIIFTLAGSKTYIDYLLIIPHNCYFLTRSSSTKPSTVLQINFIQFLFLLA